MSFGENWGVLGTILLARGDKVTWEGGQNGVLSNPAYVVPNVGVSRDADEYIPPQKSQVGEFLLREMGCKSYCKNLNMMWAEHGKRDEMWSCKWNRKNTILPQHPYCEPFI